jgi:hypothetical protein
MSGFETLSSMPDRATSGDKIAVALSDLSSTYPVGSYTLVIAMKLGTNAAISTILTGVAGVHSGTIDLTGAAPGAYAYAIKATRISDGALRSVENGYVTVLADPTSQDARTHAEKVLAAIEALIEGRATKDVSSYSIAGRSLTRMTPDELVKWRSTYRAEVARQRNAGKPNGGRKITLARFS